jgi:hypothetical protein
MNSEAPGIAVALISLIFIGYWWGNEERERLLLKQCEKANVVLVRGAVIECKIRETAK